MQYGSELYVKTRNNLTVAHFSVSASSLPWAHTGVGLLAWCFMSKHTPLVSLIRSYFEADIDLITTPNTLTRFHLLYRPCNCPIQKRPHFPNLNGGD